MRTRTPLATPVVPPPRTQPLPGHQTGEHRVPLSAPVSVVTPIGEFELSKGALLIGRLPECSVYLDDPLVSRMHARLIVQGDCVVVEDLHSANGVYLNGTRVSTTAVLREGDRILIGTTEMSLFELREASLMKVRVAPVVTQSVTLDDARTVRPGLRRKSPEPTHELELESSPRLEQPLPASFDRVPATARATALKMIGALADRLANDGDVEEAVYVVSGQLRRILQGAHAGLPVPVDVAELASHHALQVAHWTGQSQWLDYVVELHLSAHLLMAEATLLQFSDELSRSAGYDRMLLAYYVDALQNRKRDFSTEEQGRIARLARVQRGT